MRLILAVLIAVALSACHATAKPTRADFAAGLNRYLQDRGEICLSERSWPVYVATSDSISHDRDAIQMPALEKAGVVSADNVKVLPAGKDGPSIEARRYTLTQLGQRFYVPHPQQGAETHGKSAPSRDLCVAHLKLDSIVGWTPPKADKDGRQHTIVTYTYHIDAAPWTSEPAVLHAFPMLADLIRNAGVLQLKEEFVQTGRGWTAKPLHS